MFGSHDKSQRHSSSIPASPLYFLHCAKIAEGVGQIIILILDTQQAYIAEPSKDSTYQNTMASLKEFLVTNCSDAIGGTPLGEDGWPLSYVDFVRTLKLYSSLIGPVARYASDVAYEMTGNLKAYHIKLQYVHLTKEFRGETLDNAHIRLTPWMQHVQWLYLGPICSLLSHVPIYTLPLRVLR